VTISLALVRLFVNSSFYLFVSGVSLLFADLTFHECGVSAGVAVLPLRGSRKRGVYRIPG
jgi:hypothetical protein